MGKAIDLAGKGFGRWTVLGRANEEPRKNTRWLCRCVCGTKRFVAGGNLRRGMTTSCGCFWKELMTKEDSGLAALLTRYRKAAAERGLKFDLRTDRFKTLTQRVCHYCGVPPQQKTKGRFVYNGIDRINNIVGYVEGNCVPCCGKCNKAKGSTGYKDFISWLNIILKYRAQKGLLK